MSKEVEYTIMPPKKFMAINWSELWRYRNLLMVLAWRDISVRYKQTIFGVLWALFAPFSTMVIFTFIFNHAAKIKSSDGTPYPIFLYIGLLLWQYYSSIINNASISLLKNINLISKIYFPRAIIPFAAAITGLMDLFVSSVILLALMMYYGLWPQLIGLFILPLLLSCTMLSAMGIGFFLAAINVKYRDVNYILPFFIQLLMFLTPVIYPLTILNRHPVVETAILWLNPIAGIIINARAAILGISPISWDIFFISLLTSTLIFLIGLQFFVNRESDFADYI